MSDPRSIERELGALAARVDRLESVRARAIDFLPGSAVLAAIIALGALTWAQFAQVDERLDRMEMRLERVEGRLDRLEARLDRIETTLADIKALIQAKP